MIVRKYQKGDWSGITDAIEPFVPSRAATDFFDQTDHSICVTGVEDGKIAACGGLIYSGEEYVVWLKTNKAWKGSYSLARSIIETYHLMKEVVGDMAICTYVLNDFCKGEKLAKLIGLKKTDEIGTYNGNTYIKYATVT